MALVGLRMLSKALILGTSYDYFFDDEDMPEEQNSRGYDVLRDIQRTPGGNTFLYDKARIKIWELSYRDISERAKNALEHISSGWLRQQQICVIFFGTHVTGTTQSAGTYSSSQIFGTGYLELTAIPRESAFELWNVDSRWTEFGPDQQFS